MWLIKVMVITLVLYCVIEVWSKKSSSDKTLGHLLSHSTHHMFCVLCSLTWCWFVSLFIKIKLSSIWFCRHLRQTHRAPLTAMIHRVSRSQRSSRWIQVWGQVVRSMCNQSCPSLAMKTTGLTDWILKPRLFPWLLMARPSCIPPGLYVCFPVRQNVRTVLRSKDHLSHHRLGLDWLVSVSWVLSKNCGLLCSKESRTGAMRWQQVRREIRPRCLRMAVVS